MARIEAALPVDKYRMLKQQQQQAMQKHAAFSAQLKEKQVQNQRRQTDVDVADRIMKVLDSRIPKSARQYLNNQLATYLGVDPKSESFKQANAMLLGLDPNSSTMIKRQFGESIQGAEPGQIVDMTRGIMTGQLPLNDFIGQIDFTGQTMMGGEGNDQLQQPNTTTQAKTPAAKPFQGGPGSVQSFEGQRTIPAASQQASPMLVGALGLDSRTRLRNNDLFTNGYRVPMDVKDQEKLAESIITRSTGLSSTISEAANMIDLFKGKPEVLGTVGSLTRTVNTTVRQVEGMLNLLKPGLTNESDPNSAGLQGYSRMVANKIGKLHNLDMTAENSARVQAMVLGLAYRMAVANDIPGNRLTNGIIQQNLAQLGSSGSPEQFEAVLKDTIASTSREFNEHIRRTVGVDGLPVLARQLDNKDILRMAQAGQILPADMATALRDEASRRLKGEAGPVIQPAGPTLEEEERTLGQMEIETKTKKNAQTEQEMDLARRRDERAESAENRAEQREDRMASAQERSAQIEADRLAFQREEAVIDNTRADRAQDRLDAREDRVAAATENSNLLAREKFDYEKIKDRQEREQQQSQAMMNMWIQFGKAIAGIGQGGVGAQSVAGAYPSGQQDANAFRLNPTPERRAPRVQ